MPAKTNIFSLGLVIFFMNIVTPHLYAATYYVDGSSESTTNAGTATDPWKTISKANSTLSPGDTVIIATGTYNEIIRPNNNGTSNTQRIIYEAGSGSSVTVTRRIDLSSKAYVTISGIDIKASSYVKMTNSDYIVIEDSTMTGSTSNPGINMTNTSYSIVRDSIINGNNTIYQDVVTITNNAHHNLLENNHFEQGSHTLIRIGGKNNFDSKDPRYNIIRNNYFKSDYHHAMAVVTGAHHNIFEGNFIEQAGLGIKKATPDYFYNPNTVGEGWHAWQPNGIYRFNVIMKAGDQEVTWTAGFGGVSTRYSAANIARVFENRVYHNIFYSNYDLAFWLGTQNQSNLEGVIYGNNKFKNNILFKNGVPGAVSGDAAIEYVKANGTTISGDEWKGNLIEGVGEKAVKWLGTSYTIEQAETNIPDVDFKNNVSGDPLFVNESSFKFQLSSGSIGINGGVFLTNTVGSGTGKSVPVIDAKYFIDGYGIIGGDIIQIGSEEVTVVGVNYTSNVLSINRSISWPTNAGVSFPYKGTLPDIGLDSYLDETGSGGLGGDRRPITPNLPVLHRQ